MKSFDPSAPVIVGTPSAMVQRDTSRAEQVIEQAINLDRALSTNAFEMGDLFAEIIDGDYVHADHCEDLPSFLKKHNFELSAREITYRAKISRVSKRLGITREQQLKAKISKIKAIFELNPDTTYTDPTTKETSSVADIMRELVVDAGSGKQLKTIKEIVSKIRGDEENETVFETISYTKGEKVILDQAIEIIVQQSGDVVDPVTKEVKDISRGTAYVRMAGDFLADPNNSLEDQQTEPSTFQDEHFVRDNEGNDYETGAE